MSDIKTREIKKDIKLLDKAAGAARNIRHATIRTKDGIENLIDDGQVSPSEYAEDRMKYAAEDVVEEIYDKATDKNRQAREHVIDQIREHQNENRLERQKQRTDKATQRFEESQAQDNVFRTGEYHKAHAGERKTIRQARTVTRTSGRAAKAAAENRTVQQAGYEIRSSVRAKNTGIRTVEATERSIKQTARSDRKSVV